MDASREELPRVSVYSPEDWSRIKKNFANAVLTQMYLRLSAAGSSLRRDVLALHMNQHFLSGTFSRAEPNLRVNGRNVEGLSEVEQDTEPFDENLDKNIWSLADQRLKLDQYIAVKRRTKPQELEISLRQAFENQDLVDNESSTADAEISDEPDPADPISEHYPELQQTLGNIIAVTQEVDQSIPVQIERSQRVGVVASEVKNARF